jgi:glucose/arabinose dehydrogenase
MRMLTSILALVLVGCDPRGPAARSPTPASIAGVVRVDTVAQGLSNPWGLEFLPDGRMLVTERHGRLRIVDRDGTISAPLAGVPAVVAVGQGGLLDVALDPAFATNDIIYLSYAESGPDGTAGTSVARARLSAAEPAIGLDDVRVIYRQQPKVKGGNHFGSRIVFGRDSTLWITQGERFAYREQAQDLGSDLGKVVRLSRDGSIPPDNPFVSRAGARPEIWSYGHRNVQAAAMDPATGRLWTVEHGARGGDELNHPEAGKNYGWPVISYGRNYDGSSIGQGAVKAGMEQPVYYWDPVIAPSGMVFYTGDKFPEWKGNIFVGGLASQALVRLVLENGVVVKEERYLHELHERVRDVRQGDDGYLYPITDSGNGRVLRVRPFTQK